MDNYFKFYQPENVWEIMIEVTDKLFKNQELWKCVKWKFVTSNLRSRNQNVIWNDTSSTQQTKTKVLDFQSYSYIRKTFKNFVHTEVHTYSALQIKPTFLPFMEWFEVTLTQEKDP